MKWSCPCVRFDDTWLLDEDVTTICPVNDCKVRITLDLIKHFVWFDNPQSGIRAEDLNTTSDCFEQNNLFLNTIPVDQIMLPLEWIWFENDERLNYEEEDISGLVFDYILSNVRQDDQDQDLLHVDHTEKKNSLNTLKYPKVP